MPSLEDTFIANRERVQPNHANNHGSCHGGNVMKWMDETGAMSAMRLAGRTCVTAGIERMDFKRPVPVGDIASYAYRTGRTSVGVRIRVFAENPRTGKRELTTESYFTFVAVDEDGSPMEVPELRVESDRERRLRSDAKAEAGGDADAGGE
ncbi:acyl-CoA thioesterase [Halocalculus aciditolerans]|nr:acyl-CoA thioesterase [Halocalculus aciditolerans]